MKVDRQIRTYIQRIRSANQLNRNAPYMVGAVRLWVILGTVR